MKGGRMPIVDHQIGWKAGRFFLPAKLFNLVFTTDSMQGQSNGNPVEAVQAGAGELAVVQIGAAGDELSAFVPIPWDLDRDAPVLARVWFVHSSTDADAPVWILKSKFHSKQATVVDMDTSEDIATTFDAHTCSTTAESLEITDWTDLDWDSYITASDIAVGLLLECDNLGSADANEIEFVGLELAYQIKATDQAGRWMSSTLAARNPV